METILGAIIALQMIFIFFSLRGKDKHISDLYSRLEKLPDAMQSSYQTRDYLLNDNLKTYLKHIQSLEKMTLPRPVTAKMVQDVMDLDPEINTIEKEEEKSIPITDENIGRIINRDVKVMIEDMPEDNGENMI